MRAAFVVYGDLDIVSGGYIYDRAIADQLSTAGHHVEVIGLPWRTYGEHLLDNLKPGLLRSMAIPGYDVIIQDELNHPSLFLLNRWLKPRIDAPVISIVHHLRASEHRPTWQNRLYRLPEHLYLRSVDAFIYNSQTTRQIVEAVVQRPGIVVYPAGDRVQTNITPQQIEARAHTAGPLRVLFVGNLIPRKGLHTLIDALAQLPTESWHLTVIGNEDADPAYAHAIHRQVAQVGVEASVRFAGRLLDTALIAEFLAAHLLAVPSTYEGFGIVYLEAMGAGLPAIGSTAGAAHEIITDG
ncbi:MAG: glycosyltransferase family 4 protein, partial [Chloroflexi bacterium]|nr:glycosyltransferase family 4 protein [Chloroflexota bacterium]